MSSVICSTVTQKGLLRRSSSSSLPPSSILTTSTSTSTSTILSSSSGIIQEEEEEEEVDEKTTDEILPLTTSSSKQQQQQQQQQPRRSSNSKRRQSRPPTIITCASTKELLRAVNSILTTQNQRQRKQQQEAKPYIVAELGSQLRDVSNCILEHSSSKSVLVDIKRSYPKTTNPNPTETTASNKEQEPRISAMRVSDNNNPQQFREIDKLSDWRNAFFHSSSSSAATTGSTATATATIPNDNDNFNSNSNYYDVLVLDVNAIVGNDLEFTALDIILEFEQMCKMQPQRPQLQYVIVKSTGLNTFSHQLTYTKPWIDTMIHSNNQHNDNNNNNNAVHNQLCRIIATVGVNEYRQTIPDNVFQHTMGIDVGSKIIKEANKKYPNIYFKAGDAWKTAQLLRLQQEYYNEYYENNNNRNNNNNNKENNRNRKIGFDAIYIDVGGLSSTNGLLDTISLLKSIQYSLEPECIVIKSLCLNQLATRIIPYWKWDRKKKKCK
ncbi:hypothetical protein FRACYDRAFT_240808 [Fragilariopsis cylindrus CCMP1102]|uniref:Uncharacterized protein n=1 Tax=Fragilariopsis cylindrus CCMP1102 TaxID=635003 RepID=A0A1E7F8W4_9STRA|nr:hypothetical protein FRACYDRAFT_240808 [Fragilariopsis cylindrus CCMP1102]|eukprot:OEU14273.1 hypothetical protein FRACYDRAFT_240808 [Fragilariopsis cylindrus CCMP1102]